HCASRSPTRTRFDDDGCVTSGHVVLGRMAAPVYRGPSAAGAAEGERQLDSTILGTAGFGLKCSFGEREQPQVLLHVIARLPSISSPQPLELRQLGLERGIPSLLGSQAAARECTPRRA